MEISLYLVLTLRSLFLADLLWCHWGNWLYNWQTCMYSVSFISLWSRLCVITVLSSVNKCMHSTLYVYLLIDTAFFFFTRVQQFLQKSKEWLVCTVQCIHHSKKFILFNSSFLFKWSYNWSKLQMYNCVDYTLSIEGNHYI